MRFGIVAGLGLAVLAAPGPVAAQEAALSVPAEARAGSRLEVAWTGPGDGADRIAIGPAGALAYDDFVYASLGNPAVLTAPTTPGLYDVHYVWSVPFEGEYALATAPLLVTAATAILSAPDAAPAGSVVAVDWTGPDDDGDYIAVGRPGGTDWTYYALTVLGSPARILLPDELGTWELRYHAGRDGAVVATRPITAQ